MKLKQLKNIILSLIYCNKLVYAHYAITHQCNLCCNMCIKNDCLCCNELSIKQIEKLANILSDAGICFVSLSGGEPFMRKDIIDIVKIFDKYAIKIQLLTNSLLVSNVQAEQLKQIKNFNSFSISLHSFSQKTSQLIYNDENMFLKIIANINNIKNIIGSNKILLNTMISPANIDDIYDIYNFAKTNKIKISFIPIENNGSTNFKFVYSDYYKIDKIYNFLINKNKKENYIFNSTKFLMMSNSYLKGDKLNNYCHAGQLYISVNPNGNIAPCHKYHLNNLNSINNLAKIKNGCNDCLRPCWIEISNFFNNSNAFYERIKKYVIFNLIK